MEKTSDLHKPIVLGLAGRALTGKTVVGKAFAPEGQIFNPERINGLQIFWNHIYFALPLYKMASAMINIEGEKEFDRKQYSIHEVLLELFGKNPLYGAPQYDVLTSLVHKVSLFPCPKDEKPRTFLQQVGTMCREIDSECFVHWAQRMAHTLHREYLHELNTLQEDHPESWIKPTPFGVVLSDVRFINEAAMIKDEPKGILIKFVADEATVKERAYARDGMILTPEQASHESERQVDEIPEEWFTKIIDSSNMTIEEQAQATLDCVLEGALISYG